ncbi:alcohol dehydrogenase catalytic domain-containing protein [Paenibacillus sp.]|uniref:zinc-dependent alcohol dehydrogenase n=1 Tax=Paenibacillus sp. TaxID=58172 RepID=UPI002810BE75|nr:alcohol dehydrogenase catalytic domain-containing protein [Paenibacillus sp.]
MKALVWTAPETMEIANVAEPTPAEDEVIVQVEAVGICGSEIEGYLGHNSLRKPPLIMGHEFCGRIVGSGDRVSGLEPGLKVVVNPLSSCGVCNSCIKGNTQLCASRRIAGIHRPGAFGERVAVPAASVIPVPDAMNSFRAALAEPLACSLRATRRAMQRHFRPNVLVIGAGGIGILCAKVARLIGAARVIVADTHPERLKIALQTACDAVVDPRSESLAEAANREAGGAGIDVVIDAAGFQPTREAAFAVVQPGGTVMNIGLGIDETRLAINHAIRSEIEVLGSFCYTAHDFREAVRLLVDGLVTEEGWTEARPLAEGFQAFQELTAGKVKQGKLFLSMEGA